MSGFFHGTTRLWKDPERKEYDGKVFCNFGVVWEMSFGKKVDVTINGITEKKHQSAFINCTAWEKEAEFIIKWFKKGSLIQIDFAEIGNASYVDKDGNKRDNWVLNVKAVSFPIREKQASKKEVDPDPSMNDPWAEGE